MINLNTSTCFYLTVTTVSFKQSTYSINENKDVSLQVVLVLSTVSSIDITVQVTDDGNTATGK